MNFSERTQQMKEITRWMTLALCFAALAGCAVNKHRYAAPVSTVSGTAMADKAPGGNDTAQVRPDRMLIWKADMTVRVADIPSAVREASATAERHGGFVEKKSEHGEDSACLTLRVPSKTLKAAVAGLGCLGKVTYHNLEGEDVTEQYIDVEARLKNKIALRDRLKLHLEKAKDVKDILAIENELNRVQSDIDSMEGQIKSLRGKVDYATIVLNLEREHKVKPRILGPLGYLFKGVCWGVEKLFVIRE